MDTQLGSWIPAFEVHAGDNPKRLCPCSGMGWAVLPGSLHLRSFSIKILLSVCSPMDLHFCEQYRRKPFMFHLKWNKAKPKKQLRQHVDLHLTRDQAFQEWWILLSILKGCLFGYTSFTECDCWLDWICVMQVKSKIKSRFKPWVQITLWAFHFSSCVWIWEYFGLHCFCIYHSKHSDTLLPTHWLP